MSYGPAPVFRLLGLDAERISVPFSSKGVNHMAYLAHVVTVVWCVLLFIKQLCHRFQTQPTFRLSATVPRPTEALLDRSPLFHVAQYGDDIIGRELNLRKLPDRQWESRPQPYEQLRPITIKTNASTESATAAYKIRKDMLI